MKWLSQALKSEDIRASYTFGPWTGKPNPSRCPGGPGVNIWITHTFLNPVCLLAVCFRYGWSGHCDGPPRSPFRTVGLNLPVAKNAAGKKPSAISSQSHLAQDHRCSSYLILHNKLLQNMGAWNNIYTFCGLGTWEPLSLWFCLRVPHRWQSRCDQNCRHLKTWLRPEDQLVKVTH